MSGQKRKLKPVSRSTKITNALRPIDGKKTHLRDKSTIKRLAMYKAKPHRNAKGKIMGGDFMSRIADAKVKRIQPDRRWFGNTRTVGQKELELFREEMKAKVNDPYTVVLRQNKLPMGLLTDRFQGAKMNLLTTESFATTFGQKSLRKKPKLGGATDLSSLISNAQQSQEKYDPEKDGDGAEEDHEPFQDAKTSPHFLKGQSRRIWAELFKVIDSSDVLIQVLDARDPMGTRAPRIEKELKKTDRRHKHLVFVLNKCDLVPTWVTRRWVQILSAEYPTLAFHASITNPFGKGALIHLLRQLSTLMKDRTSISVGFIGYPNTGKSSIINTLRAKKVCNTAPIAGETQVWQYITLFRRIHLIDCPGTVPSAGNTDTECVLKSTVRIENVSAPEQYIDAVLAKVRPEYIQKIYSIATWKDGTDFLTQLARNSGKLLKGGEPDFNNVSRRVLHDFQRGRLPYFTAPPDHNPNRTDLPEEPLIEQLFNKISVKASFSKEDLKKPNNMGPQEEGEGSSTTIPAEVAMDQGSDNEDTDGEDQPKKKAKVDKSKKKKKGKKSKKAAKKAAQDEGPIDYDAIYQSTVANEVQARHQSVDPEDKAEEEEAQPKKVQQKWKKKRRTRRRRRRDHGGD